MTEDDREDHDGPELDAGRALEALCWCWGEAYTISVEEDTGLWLARRLDGLGVVEGVGPDQLRTEIMEDWLLRPVVVRR